ncbi:MAG: MFS transporter [Gammaproteobacteria bacterium]
MNKNKQKMTPLELRSATSLALIYFLRMFGLFMLLPVLSLYTEAMSGATPLLIGLAIGIYGLTQAMLQIPFGIFSDRFGRKPVIAIGLLIFAFGSVIAALSDDIYILILGRALQGAGAIAAAVMALASDLTRESQRTKTMAIIGVTIGMAFTLSFIAGPVLDIWLGLDGLFWMAALLGLLAIGVLFVWVPNVHDVDQKEIESDPEKKNFLAVLKNPELLRLDISILILHLVLTASFVVLPLALRDYAGLDSAQHWKTYLPVMLLSLVFMIPFIRLAEKQNAQKNLAKPIFIGATILLAFAELGLWKGYTSTIWLSAMMLAFFTAFNYLEATLPSLVSRTAPSERKGAALGVYSTSQFFGAFIGGTMGGWLYGEVGIGNVFLVNAILIIIWIAIIVPMQITPAKH